MIFLVDSSQVLQASCLQQLYYCTENRLVKWPQPRNSQDKFKKGCSQSKRIIKSADPKDNVIKTSAKSQD